MQVGLPIRSLAPGEIQVHASIGSNQHHAGDAALWIQRDQRTAKGPPDGRSQRSRVAVHHKVQIVQRATQQPITHRAAYQ